ncbi:MAG: hypothetical protein RIS86_615 [Planctomycetota bacterium]
MTNPLPGHDAAGRPLELNSGTAPFTTFATFDLAASAGASQPSEPISVAAPRATPTSGPARLSDLVARAEPLLARLESALAEGAARSEQAAKGSTDLDERLRLGVRMLQAFDVQVDRCARASDDARGTLEALGASIDAARDAIQSLAAPAAAASDSPAPDADALRGLVDEAVRRSVAQDLPPVVLDAARQAAEQFAEQFVEHFVEARLTAFGTTIDGRLSALAADLRAAPPSEPADAAAPAQAAIDARLAELDEAIEWRLSRAKEVVLEVESRIDSAVSGKLAWLDGELGARLERIGQAAARAEEAQGRLEASLASANDRAAGLGQALESIATAESAISRAERAAEAIRALGTDSERLIETLAARTGDATALREALGATLHELSAARESAQGELRRLRDDLGWLVEKGERIGGELVERADAANARLSGLGAAVQGLAPALAELESLRDLLSADGDRIAPVAESIASAVRDELRADMRGFATALRQLASRAESSFSTARIDADLLGRDARSAVPQATGLAASLASELSRLSGTATEAPPTIAVNRPVELDA